MSDSATDWPVLASAVIGALAALVGAALANLHARRLQAAQLQHDANQRNRDRQMNLRREVYFPAVEAVQEALTVLMGLTRLDKPLQELGMQFEGIGRTLAKVQVIGGAATIGHIDQLLDQLGESFLSLVAVRATLDARAHEITVHDELSKKAFADLEQLQALGRHSVATNSGANIETINAMMQATLEAQTRVAAECDALSRLQTAEHLAFLEDCYEHFLRIVATVPMATLAVRQEMEMPIDENLYIASMQARIDRQRIAFRRFIDEMKRRSEAAVE